MTLQDPERVLILNSSRPALSLFETVLDPAERASSVGDCPAVGLGYEALARQDGAFWVATARVGAGESVSLAFCCNFLGCEIAVVHVVDSNENWLVQDDATIGVLVK